MNYRHAFHAGNFADVVKHAVLARIIVHLREKPAAFRVIDSHAGAGFYDLTGPEPERTGEWRNGIGRLIAGESPADVRRLLAPYLHAVAALNPDGGLRLYPGSPALALALARERDRLIACELEPRAAAALGEALRGDRRAKAIAIDGWTALHAYIPPPERRGLVLIDPPFEAPGEFERMADALARAYRKWPTGTYVLWYPLKDRRESEAFARRLVRGGVAKILRAELLVDNAGDETRLNGAGLIIVNPPWTLHSELECMLPALCAVLARAARGAHRLDWLRGEK